MHYSNTMCAIALACGGRLVLEEKIGAGQFGEVFRGRDKAHDRPVAIKRFFQKTGQPPSFLRELEILAHLDHPSLARVYDLLVDDESGARYLTQELLQGRSANEFLATAGWESRLNIFAQLLRGLEYLHQRGIVHLDVKPSNVMVETQTAEQRARILDFGIAELLRSNSDRSTVSGTFPYLAPEVARGEPVDGRTDLYSLGMLFYVALGGRPFQQPGLSIEERLLETLNRKAPTATDLPPGTPRPLATTLARLLEPDPSRRFRSANEALRFLSRESGRAFTPEPGRLRLPDRATAFLAGRQSELAALRDAFGAFEKSGKPGWTVALVGGREQGKSALVHEFRRWIEMREVALVDLTRPQDGVPELLDRIIRPSEEGDLAPLMPYLKLLLPARFSRAPEAVPLHADLALQYARIREKIAEALQIAVRNRRCVLLVDDLPGREALADFLAYYFRHRGGGPPRAPGEPTGLFTVVSTGDRSELPRGLEPDTVIPLQPWTLEQLRAATRSLLLTEDVPDAFVAHLHRQSDGIPGAAIDQLRLVLEKLLRPGEDIEAQLRMLSPAELPAGAALPAQHRDAFERLDPAEKGILHWLSLAPRPLAESDLANLDPPPGHGKAWALRRLQDAGWVAADGGGWSLASPARSQVVTQTLDPSEKGSMWKRLATEPQLERRFSPLQRAGLLFRCGEAGAAFELAEPQLQALRKAGQSHAIIRFLEEHAADARRLPPEIEPRRVRTLAEALISVGAFGRAIELIEAEERADLHLFMLLAQAYRYNGGLDDALRVAKAARLVSPGREQADALDALTADIYLERGHFEKAARLAETHLSAAANTPPEHLLPFRHVRAKVHLQLGEVDEAIRLFERNCEDADKASLASRRALSLNSLATAYLARNRIPEAITLLENCARLAGETGDLRTLALAHVNLGVATHEQGNLQLSVRHYTNGLVTLRKVGDRPTEAWTLYNLGTLCIHRGDWTQAEDRLGEAIDLAVDLKLQHLEALARLQRSECRLRANDADGALVECERAVDLAAAAGARRESLAARLRRIAIVVARDGADAAQKALSIEEGAARELADPELDAWCLYLQAVTAGVGDAARVQPLLEQARERLGPSPAAAPVLRIRIDEALRRAGGAPSRGDLTESLPAAAPPHDVQTILEFARRINTGLEPEQVLVDIVDSMLRVTGAERGFILLKDEDRIVARVARERGTETPATAMDAFSMTVARAAIRDGKPVITLDARSDSRFQSAESVYHLQLRSIVCLPLAISGDTLGALYLDSRARARPYTHALPPLLTGLADLAALALFKTRLLSENVKAQHELRQAMEELSVSKSKAEELNRQLSEANAQLRTLLQEREEELSRAEERWKTLLRAEEPKYRYDRLIGISQAWRDVLRLVDRAVESQVPVVLQGESGTGKELVAQAIHFNSNRKDKPFVPVNAAAIPPELFESELFGYVRGAFTGADRDKPGLFEVADGGTLFLDEIGDLPLAVQAKLLRILQDGQVRRLGRTNETRVNVRLIAATHRDLKQLVEQAKFREDLYYRLCVLQIFIPPLRSRPEDIPVLARHFLTQIARQEGKPVKKLSPTSIHILRSHPWPGNVRELENAIRRAHLFSDGTHVHVQPPKPPSASAGGTASAIGTYAGFSMKEAVHDLRRKLIEKALEDSAGNMSEAARKLQMDRTRLTRWVKLLKIPRTPSLSEP